MSAAKPMECLIEFITITITITITASGNSGILRYYVSAIIHCSFLKLFNSMQVRV